MIVIVVGSGVEAGVLDGVVNEVHWAGVLVGSEVWAEMFVGLGSGVYARMLVGIVAVVGCRVEVGMLAGVVLHGHSGVWAWILIGVVVGSLVWA